ncbi:hypothetical protein B0H16DRAFT_1708004 [Mycena metata]|uniref:Uncharacterized protein n=1 Tax=Mycena metata TaxID=1033252 RepID=A0AAD7P320_9AGAR|nr:hypothetical protein B0H16DRAFT_1708002 [Mycena metata]KAJ7785759.1 hypothetical protein B0H16DRAFT_1708004 [Mycena metata]
MRPDPPFPTFSFVLSQQTQSTPPSFLVYPWTPVTYHQPVVQDPHSINAFPMWQPPVALPPNPVNTPTKILRALYQLFAGLIARLRARSAS